MASVGTTNTGVIDPLDAIADVCAEHQVWPHVDGAYSSRANRRALRARRIPHDIPEKDDQQNNRVRKASRGGRPPNFRPGRYRQRNHIERLMNRRKQFRAVATRYDKLACRYRATVQIPDIFHLAAGQARPPLRARTGHTISP